MAASSENPYQPSHVPPDAKRVYRYTELPRTCPSCSRKFSEILYRKLYPRKFQKKTLAFFVLTSFLGLIFMGCFSWFGLIPTLGLAAWGMSFHKVVRVKCNNCGWSQKYLVRNRG